MNPFTFLLFLISLALGPYFWPVATLILLIVIFGFWNTIILIIITIVLYFLVLRIVDDKKLRKRILTGGGALVIIAAFGYGGWHIISNVIYNLYEIDVFLNKEVPCLTDAVKSESKNYTKYILARRDTDAIVKVKPYVMEKAIKFYGTSPLPVKITTSVSLDKNSKDGHNKQISLYGLQDEIDQELYNMLNIIREENNPEYNVVESADSLEMD